jgi:TonB family protein
MDGLMLRFNWGERRLHSVLLRPDAASGFTVGSARGVDFACGDVQGIERFSLVPRGETRTVRFVRGMQGTLWHGDDALSLAQAIEGGEAVVDGDGYALTLGGGDAVRLELSGLSVEALPVRVPERVAGDPLESLDLRLLNIFGVVFVVAMIAIASAVADESSDAFADDDVGRTQSLAHFVVTPPPPPSRPKAVQKAPEQAEAQRSQQQASAASTRAEKPHPAKSGGDVAKQVGQALKGVLSGIGDAPALNGLGGLQAVAAGPGGGFGGLSLRGDVSGGPGGNPFRIGDSGGRGGYGPGTAVSLGKKTVTKVEITPDETVCIGIDRELVRRAIHAHHNEIRYCYDVALTRNPQLRGKASVKFVINGSGTVSTASIVDSSAHELDDCITSRVKTWVFPMPRGGGTAIITYPFVFNHQ